MEKTVSDAGKMIREMREEKQISQRELCRRIGWSSNRICDIENGRRNPKPETIKIIVDNIY